MTAKKPLTIDELAEALQVALTNSGWKTFVEDDDPDFKHYPATTEDGPLEAFTRLDLILMTLDNNPSNVEIRFHFYADPQVVGPNKRPFGKRVRENNFRILRSVCDDLLNKAGIKAKQEEIEISTKARFKMKFGRDEYVDPSYTVELVYWKQPSEQATEE